MGDANTQNFCFFCGTGGGGHRCLHCLNSESALTVPVYCGKKCRISDWAVHKYICAKNDRVIEKEAWRLEPGVTGTPPHYIATRDIEPGRIIFQRKPLLAFPQAPNDPWDQGDIEALKMLKHHPAQLPESPPVATCLSCCEIMIYGEITRDQKQLNKCRQCGWPVHSNIQEGAAPSKCEMAHQKECEIFLDRNLKLEEMVQANPNVWHGIGLLRAWLLSEDKKKQLLVDMPIQGEEFVEMMLNYEATPAIKNFLKKACSGTQATPTEVELNRLLIQVLGNVLPTMDNWVLSLHKKKALIIFEGGPTGRVLSHSCVPNCAVTLSPDLVGTFRTIKKVKKGETLTISFIGDESYCTGVGIKSIKLGQLMTYCKCKRCTTRDEDGTFLSALKCQLDGETTSFFLPQRVAGPRLDVNNIVNWRCPDAPVGIFKQAKVLEFTGTIKGYLITRTPEEAVPSVTYNQSRGPFHDTNEHVLKAKLALADYCVSELLGRIQVDPGLHRTHLPKIEEALAIMDRFQGGWTYRYGRFLSVKALLKMTELAEEILSSWNNLSYVNQRVQAIQRDWEEGIKVMVLSYPWLTARPGCTRMIKNPTDMYGVYLYKVVWRAFGRNAMRRRGRSLQGLETLRKGFVNSYGQNMRMLILHVWHNRGFDRRD